MKQISTVMCYLFIAFQATATEMTNERFTFKFQPFEGESYEYTVTAKDPYDALKKAAVACFEHFKRGRTVSVEYGQDIIDTCINPRSK